MMCQSESSHQVDRQVAPCPRGVSPPKNKTPIPVLLATHTTPPELLWPIRSGGAAKIGINRWPPAKFSLPHHFYLNTGETVFLHHCLQSSPFVWYTGAAQSLAGAVCS